MDSKCSVITACPYLSVVEFCPYESASDLLAYGSVDSLCICSLTFHSNYHTGINRPTQLSSTARLDKYENLATFDYKGKFVLFFKLYDKLRI